MFGKGNSLAKAQTFAESIRDDCQSLMSDMTAQLKAMGMAGDVVLTSEQLQQIARDKAALLVMGVCADARNAGTSDVIAMLTSISPPAESSGRAVWLQVVALAKAGISR